MNTITVTITIANFFDIFRLNGNTIRTNLSTAIIKNSKRRRKNRNPKQRVDDVAHGLPEIPVICNPIMQLERKT